MQRFAVVLAGFAVFGAAAAQSPPKAPDLATAKVIDLTHAFGPDTIYWPTSPSAFELETLSDGKTQGGWFYRSNAFCTPEHGGTHLDAPSHFAKDGLTAEKIPVRQLIAPAAVIDVRAAAAKDPDYRLTLADVKAWEKAHGAIPSGTIVLLRTGWSERWPNRKAYLGDDTPGDASKLHFPSYGVEAAKYLVTERKVGALGVDTASIDYGASQDFVVHVVAGGANVPGLENLARLAELPEWGAWVVALPMKIAGGSGGPLRAVALVP
jgi:kynurenine formamidase